MHIWILVFIKIHVAAYYKIEHDHEKVPILKKFYDQRPCNFSSYTTLPYSKQWNIT